MVPLLERNHSSQGNGGAFNTVLGNVGGARGHQAEPVMSLKCALLLCDMIISQYVFPQYATPEAIDSDVNFCSLNNLLPLLGNENLSTVSNVNSLW